MGSSVVMKVPIIEKPFYMIRTLMKEVTPSDHKNYDTYLNERESYRLVKYA